MKARPVIADLLLLLLASIAALAAADPPAQPTRGDQMLADYFRVETAKLAERCVTALSLCPGLVESNNPGLQFGLGGPGLKIFLGSVA